MATIYGFVRAISNECIIKRTFEQIIACIKRYEHTHKKKNQNLRAEIDNSLEKKIFHK